MLHAWTRLRLRRDAFVTETQALIGGLIETLTPHEGAARNPGTTRARRSLRLRSKSPAPLHRTPGRIRRSRPRGAPSSAPHRPDRTCGAGPLTRRNPRLRLRRHHGREPRHAPAPQPRCHPPARQTPEHLLTRPEPNLRTRKAAASRAKGAAAKPPRPACGERG